MDTAVLDVQFMKLPGWSCAASYSFITSHTAEYPILIRNTGAKEVQMYHGIQDLLSDVQRAPVQCWKIVRFIHVEMQACLTVCVSEPVFSMHMGFQSILKVWEVRQVGNRGGRFRCTRSCLFPSQPKDIVEGYAACASARDTSISQDTVKLLQIQGEGFRQDQNHAAIKGRCKL
eukprot:1153411-Pelagomonas_calceolata.AAC.3